MQPQLQQTQPRIKFSQQPDESQKNISTILTTIHKQQQQILQLLNKYKKTLPEDYGDIGGDVEGGYDGGRDKGTDLGKGGYGDKDLGRLNRSVFVKASRQYKTLGKYQNKSTNRKSATIAEDSKVSASVAKDKYIQYAANSKNKKVDKNKFDAYLENVRKNIKLPSVYDKSNKKKQQFEIDYEKAEKKYNENVVKFYQEISARKESGSKITKKELSKQKSHKKRHRKVESSLILPMQQKQGVGAQGLNIKKFQNIFEPDQINEAQNLIGLQHQIAKPIAYRPYFDPPNNSSPKNPSKQSRAHDNDSDSQDKPTQVSMTYYIRTFNQKWRQQCQQQINYLYFSKGDEDDTNKEWAEEIIKMFQRHDADQGKLHQSMRYLENFDEAFFTAGIYQGTQANKRGY